MSITDLYQQLFGKGAIKDGDVISMSEHGRVGGVSTGQGFKYMANAEGYINTDPKLNHAINEILSAYGDTVSVETKAKSLFKYGKNPNVPQTKATIWYTGQDQANETYVAANTNSIDSVSSGNAGDTQSVVIEGHTESDGNKTFVTQTVTLTGQTRAPLTTPLNRVTRLYNNGSTNFAGDIFVYENTALSSGKPSDTTKIHLTVNGLGGQNQSEKASTSLSSTDYWIITTFRASVVEKTATVADVELQARLSGKVFREIEDVTTSQGVPGVIKFDPYIIIPPNSDVRLQGTSSDAGGAAVSGSIFGYLAIIV